MSAETNVVNEKMKPVTTELKISSPRFYLLNAVCTHEELGSLSAKYFSKLEDVMERFAADCVVCAINNINKGTEFSIGGYTISSVNKKKFNHPNPPKGIK